MILHDFKKIKTFESFQIVDPIYWGHELGSREINYLEQYGVYCPEYIRTDDGYYYIGKYRCDHIKDVPEAYIHYICDINSIKKYTINPDFSVDVNNDVELYNKGKLPINFNKVKGNFTCRLNRLTTLKGAPREVFRDFSCSNNNLTSLEGAPNTVGGYFSCNHNQLKTLEGSPNTVGGYFRCNYNKLTTLEGAPEYVGGDFSCNSNQLTSLSGGPEIVGGDFDCSDNMLTTLSGGPERVVGNFFCYNNLLTKLEGSPKELGGIMISVIKPYR